MPKLLYNAIYVVLISSVFCESRDTYSTATVNPNYSDIMISDYRKYESESRDQMRNQRQARGMPEEPPDYHDDHPVEKPKNKGGDPWAGYYDFIINEGSFKFWAAFQLVTALLLVYSAFAAAYYAKFNVITSDYDYYDDFFARSNSDSYASSIQWPSWPKLSVQSVQNILNAISGRKRF